MMIDLKLFIFSLSAADFSQIAVKVAPRGLATLLEIDPRVVQSVFSYLIAIETAFSKLLEQLFFLFFS